MSFTCTLHPSAQGNAAPTKPSFCCRAYQDEVGLAQRKDREARFKKVRDAAVYLTTHSKPRACRCAGSCGTCKPWFEAERVLTPRAFVEVLDALAESERAS
jgi:hypothetical protein